MSITLTARIAALLCITSLFFAAAGIASADHSGGEGIEHSHAITVTATVNASAPVQVTPTYTATMDVARMQKMQELLKAMQQLVVLLQHQLEHVEAEEGHHN